MRTAIKKETNIPKFNMFKYFQTNTNHILKASLCTIKKTTTFIWKLDITWKGNYNVLSFRLTYWQCVPLLIKLRICHTKVTQRKDMNGRIIKLTDYGTHLEKYSKLLIITSAKTPTTSNQLAGLIHNRTNSLFYQILRY